MFLFYQDICSCAVLYFQIFKIHMVSSICSNEILPLFIEIGSENCGGKKNKK